MSTKLNTSLNICNPAHHGQTINPQSVTSCSKNKVEHKQRIDKIINAVTPNVKAEKIIFMRKSAFKKINSEESTQTGKKTII